MSDATQITAVASKPLKAEPAGMGSIVTYVDETSGREAAHKLVLAQEAKPADGLLSIDSPVGRALSGAQPGDTRSLQTPKGARTMRVLAVKHP
jgi:transcription elongation factor GreA